MSLTKFTGTIPGCLTFDPGNVVPLPRPSGYALMRAHTTSQNTKTSTNNSEGICHHTDYFQQTTTRPTSLYLYRASTLDMVD